MTKKLKLSLYRFDPTKDKRPYMSDYEIPYFIYKLLCMLETIVLLEVALVSSAQYVKHAFQTGNQNLNIKNHNEWV